ncbi:putative Endonuclease/Exonuclease/phosphatase family protein [Fulvimarina pelagi HTCC2506]|uniref:Putative Endonuclease/Exonuclease/phosphatase family protein n=1 Tax=Fulvimarina pelagi HTCC2506 TaxID=314231 RepID=Q0G7K9_9HYPH|nr:endonuclease/exonuclease/phosphatase family protein [Fulvimarina pelagi]EAU42355.1 putative Endonuclease/Exonuclease/phosphatase family protein [Fulvimarina pelagi HTCC2506]
MSLPSVRPPGTLRIVSWNIHGAIGRRRRPNPERTIAEIERMAPDILILQEVDGRTMFGRAAGAFEYVTGALWERLPRETEERASHIVEARTADWPSDDIGNLLWSRFPVSSSRIIDLPGPDIENRKVIEAIVELGGRRLRVLGTHLALLPTTRLKQARTIVDHLTGIDHLPTVLGGDLNEWFPNGWVHSTLSCRLPKVHAPRTWPERVPIAPLDRFYASQDVEIVARGTDARAGVASDHRAISIDVRV